MEPFSDIVLPLINNYVPRDILDRVISLSKARDFPILCIPKKLMDHIPPRFYFTYSSKNAKHKSKTRPVFLVSNRQRGDVDFNVVTEYSAKGKSEIILNSALYLRLISELSSGLDAMAEIQSRIDPPQTSLLLTTDYGGIDG